MVQVPVQGQVYFCPSSLRKEPFLGLLAGTDKISQPYGILVLAVLPAVYRLLKIAYGNFPDMVSSELKRGEILILIV